MLAAGSFFEGVPAGHDAYLLKWIVHDWDDARSIAILRACHGAMSGRGTLFSWVVVKHPFLPQFSDLTPFVPALVALEEDPAVRLPTRMVDCEADDLDYEMAVQVVFRPLAFTDVAGPFDAPLFVPA